MSRPAFSWSHLGLIAAGGAVGTALRAGIIVLEDPSWAWLSIPLINIVGAFGLGIVTGLAARSTDSSRSRALRQFFGAGIMGGFTTYSTFAVQSVEPFALLIALATVVAGTLAAWAGLLIGRPRT
ncbi:fluoride efflux transporter CrcB [Microbacterium aoyamense]|uniref:Fluoride-specific ion channel FluC n=1 Tax=Microbacterium aoyamense TaxID=344166 RepID=A0ABP5AQV4_9MICO|nr:CrcB family protein [Microbacterium aoyamense]